MKAVAEVAQAMEGLGFERIETIAGSTFKDSSTVVIVPTRGMIHHRTVAALQALIPPMNQKRALLFAAGHEVGRAYDALVDQILASPDLSQWKYIMTIEDDNLVPPDAHVRLLESIELGPFDAVSGIYFTKGEIGMPMAYGDPTEYRTTGVIDFRPRDIRGALAAGRTMEVNGIAMGCALWRMELFKKIPAPWFQTVADVVEGKGVQAFTQDLWFCQRARTQHGARFAVDLRCRVGHLDVNTGIVY